jgi:hypothetical protein
LLTCLQTKIKQQVLPPTTRAKTRKGRRGITGDDPDITTDTAIATPTTRLGLGRRVIETMIVIMIGTVIDTEIATARRKGTGREMGIAASGIRRTRIEAIGIGLVVTQPGRERRRRAHHLGLRSTRIVA